MDRSTALGAVVAADAVRNSGPAAPSAGAAAFAAAALLAAAPDGDGAKAALEERLACATRFGAAAARERWLDAYAACLASSDDANRLRRLAASLADEPALLRDHVYPALRANPKHHALLSELEEADKAMSDV